jgi:ABC-2 type transport system ATP-binding protein
MLQRLGFISAILHDPEFLLFDEPLSGLDPHGRQEFKEVLIHLHRQGKTIFFSSHIVPDVEEVCDDVLLLDKGKILEHCSISDLLEKNEQNQYRLRYRKDGKEQTMQFASYRDSITYIEENSLQLVELQKIRPRLEEIIYNKQGKKE